MLVEHIDELPMFPASHSTGNLPVLFGTAFAGKAFQAAWSHVEYVIVPAGSAIPVHKHVREEEVYFLFEGSGILTVDGREQRVGPGILTACPAGSAHGLTNDGGGEIKLIVVGVKLPDGARHADM